MHPFHVACVAKNSPFKFQWVPTAAVATPRDTHATWDGVLAWKSLRARRASNKGLGSLKDDSEHDF